LARNNDPTFFFSPFAHSTSLPVQHAVNADNVQPEQGISLVTGASGFVGSALVDYLCRLGRPVRAMVRNPAAVSPLQARGIPVVLADLRDYQSLLNAVQGVDAVYHIAALFRQAGLPAHEFYEVNAEGTRRLLDAALAAGVRRVVHCSTVGVLGHISNPPADETTPYNPGDVYQHSKMEGEKIALQYFRSGKIPGVVIRPAMIYGPGDRRTLKLFRMIARRRFFYVGSGELEVHFVDVRDLVRAFVMAMDHQEISGQVYIIAGERALPLREMVEIIARELGVPPPRWHLPVRPMQWLGSICEAVCTPLRIQPPIFRRRVDFFTKRRSFDISKAKRELGYQPARSLEQEVAEIIAWYRQHGWL